MYVCAGVITVANETEPLCSYTHTHEHRLLAVISNVIVETAKYNVILLVLSGYQPCHYSSSCCGDKLLRYGGKYGLGNVVI